jgi:NAD(P) transhydrogenase
VSAAPPSPDAPTAHFDLLAIGGGPAGQKAAIQAAKLGRRSAIVEQSQLGGCSVFSGTIPSKTLREAVMYLTGFSQRSTDRATRQERDHDGRPPRVRRA